MKEVEVITLAPVRGGTRVRDYVELTKPELTLLSVITAFAGYFMAAGEGASNAALVHLLFATALIGGGLGSLNQYIERDLDALMRRTERRPLPAGRLRPVEALAFGAAASTLGIVELFVFCGWLTGLLGALTFVSYLWVYTPLKRVTPLSTLVGGLPGALPPLIGWAAARGSIDAAGWAMFAILFFWQMPHFHALAWMYRKDYARAGYPMRTVVDESGRSTLVEIFWTCALLIPASIIPSIVGISGEVYLWSAVLLGLGYLGCAIFLAVRRTNDAARTLFSASLIYLPVLMIVMMVDKL
jgi:protoheme IX farnesyltransferase